MLRLYRPFLACALALCAACDAFAALPEIRGTWVTTTGLSGASGTIKDPATTATNFRKLRDIGLNSIYMDAWRNGYTQFPSSTMQATIGVGKDPLDGSRDLLQE